MSAGVRDNSWFLGSCLPSVSSHRGGRKAFSGASFVREALSLPLPSLPSLIAQLVKNPPAMQETWVRSLGWEDPLKTGKVTHSSILAWIIPWTV